MKETLLRSGHDAAWLPSLDEFGKAVRRATGSAGYDGWHSTEVKLIAEYFDFLICELYELWCDTCEYVLRAAADSGLQHLIFSWRVVGIPQKVRENKKTVAAMRQSLF